MANTPSEAITAVHDIMVRREFGGAGDEIVIEETLHGDEISITFITDGRTLKLFPVGQDAQRVFDGNLGPNTGGMGVYAPTPLLSCEQIEEITRTVLNPTIEGIQSFPFIGFICIGLMMTAQGPKLIEYNARFGDPEAQTLLPMLEEDSDLATIMVSCINQQLDQVNFRFKETSAVSVVMTSEGYPGQYCVDELKLSHSPSVDHVFVFPGNGGTAKGLAKVSNIRQNITDYTELVSLARHLAIDLVVVGPDDAVVGGIEGLFRDSGIPCFAPTKEAAEIEGSKAYAKGFMKKYGVPTAGYEIFDDIGLAKAYVSAVNHRIVIKASGLAAGKGVVLPTSKEEAYQALEDMMVKGLFASAGSSVVIEEYLEGDEISLLTFSDGESILTLPPCQDHKRIFENNTGPNTGGMGAYTPVPFVNAQQMDEIDSQVLRPTFAGLEMEGRTFRGMLFTGIIMTSEGPKVLEYNARFGDPETQSLMMLLSPESDLALILLACTQQNLKSVTFS
ncbi:Bifunctional purine biosynthetic protein ADE1 [Colletotrichum spinosum]|uniref:Bifunctional purine biosynthetic protein ADE1 n=1 Tax=Colletotrichum spinosum TaxID=1347390 RepID=A0A4R8QDN1_9PEZI|nr:Bifunctional purine biosynthetic protein ADE1 [Colletotrichum spinosum]